MKILKCLSVFLLLACATPYERLGTTLTEVAPKLKDSYSFAFLHKGDRYFFAPEHFKQGRRECYLYLGFKNEKLTYAFSGSVFGQLEKTYAANDNAETIKTKLLETIQDEKPTPNKCYEVGQGPPPDVGQGVGILIFLFPITIPIGSYAFVVDQLDKSALHDVSSHIELGMPKDRIPEFIRSKWKKKTKGKSIYYEYDQRNVRIILYFEDEKLNAWSESLLHPKPL